MTQSDLMFAVYIMLTFIILSLAAWVISLQRHVHSLRIVCCEAYQMAGVLGAGEKVLDNLSAACGGEPIPHETFLPVHEPEAITFLSQEIRRLEQENFRLRAKVLTNAPESLIQKLTKLHEKMAGLTMEEYVAAMQEVNKLEH